ncbi:MAG: beta-galactosidase, partial [Clostridiales bacterium]|nr:beta-galactosidase [Clostridiales bacterium]
MSKQITEYQHFLHGGDYNPEQWLDYPEILEKDIELMKKAHCNAMSIGIFSWAFLEPEEGVYNFEYMDKIIKKLTDNGIKIILATPSGARPRWLAKKYPEVLRVGDDRRRNIYGSRHNHCYTSPVYREKVAMIDRKLAERYGKNPNVLMWHISNEYGGECHCDLCQHEFREWLKRKYNNDLKKLNTQWWTGFWSHTITDWEQIESPSSIGEGREIIPGLTLDWQRFVTYQTTEFMRAEIAAVRNASPDIPVTTNFMGTYQPFLDYHYMKNFVDVISWDAYPDWHSDRGNVNEAIYIAFNHDLHRSFKHSPFMMMESTPSLTNWKPVCALKKPGMHKLSSIQAVAHGSNTVQYFQWRKGRGGSEKFHGAVIDHNGKGEGRVFDDVKNTGILLEKLDEVIGSDTKSDVAIIYEFQNRWALRTIQGFKNDGDDREYSHTCKLHYAEMWKRGINTDVIGMNDDLSGYKLIIIPMLYLVTDEFVDKIERFVKNGGTVVATYMTGYVNENDLCYLGGFPGGKLKDVFGLTADEIDSLYESTKNSVKYNGKVYDAIDYCELITGNSAQTLGEYQSDFCCGKPCVLKNGYGKG